MPEFVEDDAEEEQQEKDRVVDRRLGPGLLVHVVRQPGEQQEEGHVNLDLGAREPPDGVRPAHGGPSTRPGAAPNGLETYTRPGGA